MEKVREAVAFVKGCMEEKPFPEFDLPLIAEASVGDTFGNLMDCAETPIPRPLPPFRGRGEKLAEGGFAPFTPADEGGDPEHGYFGTGDSEQHVQRG